DPLFVPISDRPDQQVPLMVNPVNPEVQDYELSIMKEFVGAYGVDGVLYDDRFRFAGINADFGDLTRAAFEEHIGKKLSWPEDVFKFTLAPTFEKGIAP